MQFYYNEETFARDVALHQNQALACVLLTPLQASSSTNNDSRLLGQGHAVWPPFCITDRGEPLSEWVKAASASRPMDGPTTIFVLLHIVERLQLLHAAGYAHCRLCPASIVWLQRLNAWRLTDLEAIVAIGAPLPHARAGTLAEAVSTCVLARRW